MSGWIGSDKIAPKILVFLGVSWGTMVQAQTVTSADEPMEQGGLAEIVVTANKREQSINDVGMAISALSGDQLSSRRLSSLADIASAIPGLSYTPTATATPVYTLRGVGFYESSLANYPTTSVYIDEVPLPFPVMAQHAAYDVARIEVLKGPQGTLFGQNSTGGAINFVAAPPTRDFEAGGDVSFGRFNRIEGNGYVSGPISNTLTARLAVTGAHADDWQRSYLRDDTLGEVSYYGARLLMNWEASDDLTVKLNVNGWQDKSNPQASQLFAVAPQAPATLPVEIANQPLAPRDARAAEWSPDENRPRANNRLYQAVLRFDRAFDTVTLTGISSYVRYNHFQVVDQDGTRLLDSDIREDSGTIDTFTQEVRLANSDDAALRWVIGANFERSDVSEFVRYDFPDESTAPLFGFTGNRNTSDQKLRNYAAFGNVEYDLAPAWTVKVGSRYTKAKRSARQCTFDNGDGTFAAAIDNVAAAIQLGFIPIPGFTPSGVAPPSVGNGCTALDNLDDDGTPITYLPGAYRAKLNEDNVSWRVGLDYKPSRDLLLYANVSKGYKAGSFPLSSAATFEQYIRVTQESLLDYEAGFKLTTLRGKLNVSGAAFYYDYKDKQIRGKIIDPIFGNLEALDNVPKSRIYGLEFDAALVPLTGLTISLSGTYLNSEITDYVNFSASSQVTDFAGAAIPYTPKWSGSLAADYKVQTQTVSPFVGISVTGRTATSANIGGDRGFTPPEGYRSSVPLGDTYRIPGYALVDLRAGIEGPDGRWKVTVFGKNVFDRYYATNTYKNFDTVNRLTGMPATYGVSLSVRYR